jgi:hypothetical protein
MAIINLNNNHFNNESSRLSPHKIFAYKNKKFTDKSGLFYEKLNFYNLNEVQKELVDINEIEYLYGLQQPDAFQQQYLKSSIKEINSTTKTKNLYVNNSILSSNTNYELSKPDLVSFIDTNQKNLEIDTRYFGIKRLQNELRPFSPIVQKKKIIKNLYKSTMSLDDAKMQQSFNYGFYNYNCLNFFNIEPSTAILNSNLTTEQKNKLIENTHSCSLIYSNKILNNKNVYPNSNKTLTINFWINPKRLPKKDYYYNPGCIINIPNVISVYLMEEESKRTDSESFYYLTTQLSEYSNTNSPRKENLNRTFSSQNYLNHNRWYNITLVLNQNNINIYTNDQVETFNINNPLSFIASESVFTIGNKFNLSQNDFVHRWNETENIRKYFFNKYNLTKQALNNKEILVDESVTDITIDTTINNIFNTKLYALSTLNIEDKEDESFALNAELQGISIFNIELNYSSLLNFINGNDISLLNSESILFYLPCCYISNPIEKMSYITFGEINRIKYSSYINPYFSNKVMGNEISVENFLIDFISKRKPFITGMEPVLHNDSFLKNPSTINGITTEVREKKSDIIKSVIKYHKNPNQIYNSVYTDIIPFIDTTNFSIDSFVKNNLIYRNNFILPCDNGLNNLNLSDYILSNFSNSSNFLKNEYYNQNYMQVSCDNNLSLEKYSNYFSNNLNKAQNFFNNFDIFKSFLLDDDTGNGLLFKNYSTRNVSKFYESYFSQIFLDNNTKNINENIYNILDNTNAKYNSFFDKMKNVSSNNKFYITNTIFKNFDDETGENLSINSIFSIEKIQNGNIISGSITIPYKDYYISNLAIEGEVFETNSVIFDISNKLYASRIRKENISITDYDISGTGGSCSISLKDDGKGLMYRADCLTPHAKWNYVGHIFYRDGLINILHPGLTSFGENNFICELKGDHKLFTYEINVPIEKGELNISKNKTFKKLRPSEGLYDVDEENFVYLTGVNLHDENLNVVAKANFAQPIVKRQNDRYNIRLKMDY